MGYFSNRTEGMAYENHYCMRCVHLHKDAEWNDCPVWILHMNWNYDATGKTADPIKQEALETFIPTQGTENLQCLMFIERKQK